MTVRDDLDRHVAAWLATDAPTSPTRAPARRRPRADGSDTASAGLAHPRKVDSHVSYHLAGRDPARRAVADHCGRRAPHRLDRGHPVRRRFASPAGAAAVRAGGKWRRCTSRNGDLMAADSPTATPRKILAGDTVDNGPLLSPDGTRMVFVRGLIGGTQAELWTADSEASAPRKLVDAPRIGWAEWSPQSDTIAILRDDEAGTIVIGRRR